MVLRPEGPGIDASVLKEAVEGSQWTTVLWLAHADDCTREQQHWAIECIIKDAPEDFIDNNFDLIWDHCDDDKLVSVVFPHILKRRLWRHVAHFFKRKITPTQHWEAVELASKHADEVYFNQFILPLCTDEELKQVTVHMVSRGLWRPADRGVKSDVSIAQYILSHFMSRFQWNAVSSFLQRSVSSDVRRWVLEQAIGVRHAGDHNLAHNIIPHCHREELQSVLELLVSKDLWTSVGSVLRRGVTPTQRKWIVEYVLKREAYAKFTEHVLPVCTQEEVDQALIQMVKCGKWSLIPQLLRKASSNLHMWAVEEASKIADEGQLLFFVLNEYSQEELPTVLNHLVSRGLWSMVGEVLGKGVGSAQHLLAVEEALKRADEDVIVNKILPQCNEGELGLVLAHMVSRRLWKPADSVAGSDFSVSQLILSQMMSRGLWKAVDSFLRRGDCRAVHSWAVEEASQHVGDYDFSRYILPNCLNAELGIVLKPLVSRGRWKSVDKVLHKGVSSTLHSWAVEQASIEADVQTFVDIILPHCTEEELHLVLRHMVLRGIWKPITDSGINVAQHILSQLMSHDQWQAVTVLLQRGLSRAAVHSWAMTEISRRADADFVHHRLTDLCRVVEELESVLIHLVERRLWRTVHKVFQEAAGKALGKDIIPRPDEQFTVRRGQIGLQKISDIAVFRSSYERCFSLKSNTHFNATLCRWVITEAAKHADDDSFHDFIMRHCHKDDLASIVPHLVAGKKWRCVQKVMLQIGCDMLYSWISSDQTSDDASFWRFLHDCRVDVSLAFELTKSVTQVAPDSDYPEEWSKGTILVPAFDLAHRVSWPRMLCELLMASLLHTVCDVLSCDERKDTYCSEHTKQRVSNIYALIAACVEDNALCVQDDTLVAIQNKEKWTLVFTELADTHSNEPLFLLHFLQSLNLYDNLREREKDGAILLIILAVFPLFPQLQSVALRMMLRGKRWDVLSQACLSHLWEHDQRRLFKAAVMQRQWGVVRQWCDHTVHVDQRHWALTEAFKEKQWEVYLLLADHGLTPAEQMYAHYRVAKYGHWATVLNMVDRGGDITEVSNLLEKWVMRYLRRKPEGDVTVYEQRCMKLIRLRLRFARKSVLSPRKALERCLWGTVLFSILHKPTKRFFSEVLNKVLQEQQWHVLMHLVRLGMSSADRDRLFPDMVRQQQWGVCRQLLEHGVDDQLCLEALPELMEKNQWMLVARVMEHDVDDAVRRQVLLWAFQRRAGALFWHCLNTMEEQERLSTETQHKLFHQAISREIWQAVKPLVKKQHNPDIQRRDLAFLEAIEQHLWDVVDFCQRLGADINMKDENGETPLLREARKEEWKAVEEIVLRDGYPNLLDKDGFSVLNRLIRDEQWDIVKVVIMYGGDIHLRARYWEYRDVTYSPLQALIDVRQADVMHFSVMWCGDQKKGVNDIGERVLHAVCDSDRWDVMKDLIFRKVDPLALTKTGKSPLAYAVLNTKCGKRMVAECGRQGFTFHQPSLTGPQESLLTEISSAVVGLSEPYETRCKYIRWNSQVTSPLVCAVLCDLPVVAFMLYESGSCSSAELLTLYAQLPKLANLNTEEGGALHERVIREVEKRRATGDPWDRQEADRWLLGYSCLTHLLQRYTPFLRDLATTPRPLLSACRLRITGLFHFSDTYRDEKMAQFRLPGVMKKYLEFRDLCDPNYCGNML